MPQSLCLIRMAAAFLVASFICLQVIELAQEMTPPMVAIYDSITDLLDVCIKHLKRSNKIDTSDFSLEECLFRSFDEIVRRQLDSVWHTITPQTKQVNSVLDLHVQILIQLKLYILETANWLALRKLMEGRINTRVEPDSIMLHICSDHGLNLWAGCQ